MRIPRLRPGVFLAAAVAAVLAVVPLTSGLMSAEGTAAGAPWRDAAPGYVFRFPADHASHPEYQIEWWYYTGNLDTRDGRRFGYQVTFFRVGIDAAPANPSRWAVRDLYMAHLAVTDPSARRYRYDERLSRSGPGLAGALPGRYLVWNEDWSARLDDAGRHVLRAAGSRVGIDLVLDEGEGPIVNGVDGISQKGARRGNASHYYSLMRMPTRGTLSIDGERFDVTGASWMDHEFGTSFLEPDQQGWDWLSLQLDDGSELMLYQMRRADGGRDPHSSGTFVRPDGRVSHLTSSDFTLAPAGRVFSSPASGARYPVAWRVVVPGAGIELNVTTPLEDQELRTARSTGVTYWEGAVDAAGTIAGRNVSGRGYLEMTGYAGSMGRVFNRD
jgi:predicted secreted hydrolase